MYFSVCQADAGSRKLPFQNSKYRILAVTKIENAYEALYNTSECAHEALRKTSQLMGATHLKEN